MSYHVIVGWLRGACMLAVLAALTSSCGRAEAPEPRIATTAEPLTSRPGAGCLRELLPGGPRPRPYSCPAHSCGNSAEINTSIIEALDVRGEMVQDLRDHAFRLVPGRLTNASGGCKGLSGLSLAVRDGDFVGVTRGPIGDSVKCSGVDLVGARFEVEQIVFNPPGRKNIVTIQIAERAKVTVWRGELVPSEDVPTYDLVYTPASTGPVPASPIHLCTESAWSADIVDIPPRLGGWHKRTHHAVLIQGETYKRDATVGFTGGNWFNIGCTGSAISKMRLLGLDPMKSRKTGEPSEPNDGKSTVGERQATLKMLTAKYCGDFSWTKNGTRILLRHQNQRGAQDPTGSSRERVGPIESRWGVNGALCISHLRLWSAGSECAKSDEVEQIERIQRECKIPACDETEPCSEVSAVTNEATIWRTCTVDHIPR